MKSLSLKSKSLYARYGLSLRTSRTTPLARATGPVELVLIACLLKEPRHCEQHFLPTAQQMGMMECVVTGQFQVVQWHEQHPG